MPTDSQVKATLPHAFKEKYPNTYAIMMQVNSFLKHQGIYDSSLLLGVTTKHHNTAKLLNAGAPNGAISYISSLYVGSISDVQLTRVSRLIPKLSRNDGVSVMADRGFHNTRSAKQIRSRVQYSSFP